MTPLDWIIAIVASLGCIVGTYRAWLNGTQPARTAARMREVCGIEKQEPDDHARLVMEGTTWLDCTCNSDPLGRCVRHEVCGGKE